MEGRLTGRGSLGRINMQAIRSATYPPPNNPRPVPCARKFCSMEILTSEHHQDQESVERLIA